MRGSGVFWPLSLPVLVVLGLLLAVMAGLVQVGTLVYAYERIGIDRSWLLALLGLSIVGSTVNLPVARLRSSVVLGPQVIRVYGIRYLVPAVRQRRVTVIAANVGGALVPAGVAAFLIAHEHLGTRALVAAAEDLARPHPAPAGLQQRLGQAGVEERELAPLVDHARLGDEDLLRLARLRCCKGTDERLVVRVELVEPAPGGDHQLPLAADAAVAGHERGRLRSGVEVAQGLQRLPLAFQPRADPQALAERAEPRPGEPGADLVAVVAPALRHAHHDHQPAAVPTGGDALEVVDALAAADQQLPGRGRKPPARLPADPVPLQPALGGAASDRLARGELADAQRLQRPHQRGVPHRLGVVEHELAQHRQQQRPRGRSAQGPPPQQVWSHHRAIHRRSRRGRDRVPAGSPGSGGPAPRSPGRPPPHRRASPRAWPPPPRRPARRDARRPARRRRSRRWRAGPHGW